MFVVRLAFFPIKVGTKATKVAAKTGYRTGRVLGYRRLFVFGLGVAVGILFAPGPGAELREKLRALIVGEAAEPEPPYPPPPVNPTDRLLAVTGTNGHS
jgi:hypothetical protein